MKALLVRMRSLDRLIQAVRWPLAFHLTSCNRFEKLDDYQASMDEYFVDGFIPEQLKLGLVIDRNVLGERWDATFLRLECNSLDDCRAAFCQAMLGEGFLAIKASLIESEWWRAQLVAVTQKHGYVAFAELFKLSRQRGSPGEGMQIWSARDCGFVDATQADIVISGTSELLLELDQALMASRFETFATSFALDDDSHRWVDI